MATLNSSTARLPSRIRRRRALGRATDHFSWPRDPLRIMLVLLVIITVSRVHMHFSVIGRLRPALVLTALTLLYAVLNKHALSPEGALRTWPARVVAGLGVLACLSIPFGMSIGNSGRFVLDAYSKVLIFSFLLMASIRTTRDLAAYVWAFVISTGILVWMSITVFDLADAGTLRRLDELYTYDANDLGCILSIGLPLSLLTFQTSGKVGKWVSVAVMLGIGAGLARSGSRGGFLGLIAVGIALLLMLKHVALIKRLAVVAVVAAGLVIAAPPGYWTQMSTITSIEQDYNWTDPDGRKALALRGLGYMLRYPVFGIGIANFERAEGLISEKALEAEPDQGIRWTAPHNSYVQVGAEMGFPALVLWLSLVIGGIVGMVRLRRRLPHSWRTGSWDERFLFYSSLYLPIALIGFGVTAAFVSFAYMDAIYILAALMVGLYRLTDSRLRGTARSPSAARTLHRGGYRPGPRLRSRV